MERSSFHSAGREGCGALLGAGAAQPFPHASSGEAFANSNHYNTKEEEHAQSNSLCLHPRDGKAAV